MGHTDPYRVVVGQKVGHIFESIFEVPGRRTCTWGPALFAFIARVIATPNAGSALGVDPATHHAGRHYAWLRVGRPAPDFCARVRCRRDDLTHEPGSERGVREPSIWRARAPISICGPTAQMERSGPLAGVSRRPSAAPDIDPRAGDQGQCSLRSPP